MKNQIANRFYYVNSDSKNNVVEVWSTARLPFEPKDNRLCQMRTDMRAAIHNLSAGKSNGLHTTFISSDGDVFDVENILLYNIGTGAFSHLCTKSLCLERCLENAPPYGDSDQTMPFYYRYETVKDDDHFQFWKDKTCLAKWENIEISSLKNGNKPHTIWNAMKSENIQIFGVRDSNAYLGMNLKIKSPKGQKVNLSAVVKPLIDGIISSFHEDTLPDDEAVSRLSRLLHTSTENISEKLRGMLPSPLGRRKIIHPFRGGIQWNPADDLCVAIHVELDDCIDDEKWMLSGNLFTVEESRNAAEVIPKKEAEPVIIPGIYRHFKGKAYKVITLARHSETKELMVVYQALYGERGIWVRPASMWNEMIVREGKTIQRFTRVSD